MPSNVRTYNFSDFKDMFDNFNDAVGRTTYALQSFLANEIRVTYAASNFTSVRAKVPVVSEHIASGSFGSIVSSSSPASAVNSYARIASRADTLTKALVVADVGIDLSAYNGPSYANRIQGIYLDDSIAASVGALAARTFAEISRTTVR